MHFINVLKGHAGVVLVVLAFGDFGVFLLDGAQLVFLLEGLLLATAKGNVATGFGLRDRFEFGRAFIFKLHFV